MKQDRTKESLEGGFIPLWHIEIMLGQENLELERLVEHKTLEVQFGYIDVGDGCWRRNVLLTVLSCW